MRFLSFALAGLAVYGVLLYSVPPGKKRAPIAPATKPPSLRAIIAAFILGIAALFLIDGAIFHSGFYTRYLNSQSFAGLLSVLVRSEQARPPSKERDVALVGDSTVLTAFSAKAANERATGKLKFFNLAMPAAAPRVLYYFLREIDPRAERYRAIVLGLRFADNDQGPISPDRGVDLHLIAPLLRSTDTIDFARSFRSGPDRRRAATISLLRGYAFRSDLRELLTHPIKRLRHGPSDADILTGRYEAAANDQSLEGIIYDPVTKRVHAPPHLAKFQHAVEKSLQPRKNHGLYAKYRRQWLGRILQHYAHSSTVLVLAQLPRGPLGGSEVTLRREDSIKDFVRDEHTLALDAHLFDDLERPEFFSDRHHLNNVGRELFTERMTDELLSRFEPGAPNQR